MKDKKAIKAVKILKKYCAQHELCEGCVFYSPNCEKDFCIDNFKYYPETWKIKKLKKDANDEIY